MKAKVAISFLFAFVWMCEQQYDGWYGHHNLQSSTAGETFNYWKFLMQPSLIVFSQTVAKIMVEEKQN